MIACISTVGKGKGGRNYEGQHCVGSNNEGQHFEKRMKLRKTNTTGSGLQLRVGSGLLVS